MRITPTCSSFQNKVGRTYDDNKFHSATTVVPVHLVFCTKLVNIRRCLLETWNWRMSSFLDPFSSQTCSLLCANKMTGLGRKTHEGRASHKFRRTAPQVITMEQKTEPKCPSMIMTLHCYGAGSALTQTARYTTWMSVFPINISVAHTYLGWD